MSCCPQPQYGGIVSPRNEAEARDLLSQVTAAQINEDPILKQIAEEFHIPITGDQK